MSYEHEAYNENVQYADCKLVSIQHGSARLHRRDTEVPILQCWPDRLRKNLPLQKSGFFNLLGFTPPVEGGFRF